MFYAVYLRPSRADFMQTMSKEEMDIMQQHILYWNKYLEDGVMHIFGPVLDPNGAYGLGIVEVENEEVLKTLIDHDPASKINKYEYFPMKAVTKK